MNLTMNRRALAELRTSLQAERENQHIIDLELGVGVALSEYIRHQQRLTAIDAELAGLQIIEQVLDEVEERTQRDLQAIEALRAERMVEAEKLFKRLNNMPYGPEYS